jgi:CDP-6-deoxy-D-xylo-4-hexulose-3-dehydrase
LYKTDFKVEGCSNYAFTLVLNNADFRRRDKIEEVLKKCSVEFRRGLSGGGNQIRQPYLKNRVELPNLKHFENVEHIHNFSWYIGNYPELDTSKIPELTNILNTI